MNTNTEEKTAQSRMQGKAVIPLPGVNPADLPETADGEPSYDTSGTGIPFQPAGVKATGSIGYTYILGAAVLGYFLFVKK